MSRIVGVGVDVLHINRMAGMLQRRAPMRLARHILHPSEQVLFLNEFQKPIANHSLDLYSPLPAHPNRLFPLVDDVEKINKSILYSTHKAISGMQTLAELDGSCNSGPQSEPNSENWTDDLPEWEKQVIRYLGIRFAIKEAAFKAMYPKTRLTWHQAMIIKDRGKPMLHLSDLPNIQPHVSVTHDADIIAAVAVMEQIASRNKSV
ncbi:hypothetical protein QVD99_003434 [Batrachochytrium dendrobatidis]|nr:hypothetical protein QVD99_003434 [Batrachochytrium dendrobatidis]